jgi:hypothetical protein
MTRALESFKWCTECKHLVHSAGLCKTVLVSGPPSDKGHKKYGSETEYVHLGRTVTPCECQTGEAV